MNVNALFFVVNLTSFNLFWISSSVNFGGKLSLIASLLVIQSPSFIRWSSRRPCNLKSREKQTKKVVSESPFKFRRHIDVYNQNICTWCQDFYLCNFLISSMFNLLASSKRLRISSDALASLSPNLGWFSPSFSRSGPLKSGRSLSSLSRSKCPAKKIMKRTMNMHTQKTFLWVCDKITDWDRFS